MKKLIGTSLGILTGIALLSIWISIQIANNHSKPLSEWIKTDKIEIPDFKEGENPIIIFPVSIQKDVTFTWTSKTLSTIYAGQVLCKAGYTVSLKAEDDNTYKRLGDISGGCKLPIGQYYLTYEIDMNKPGYGHKHIKNTSNIFEVK